MISDRSQTIEEIFQQGAEAAARERREHHERLLHKSRLALEENAGDPNAYLTVARILRTLGQDTDAISVLTQGLRRCAPSSALYQAYVSVLEDCNRTQEAIAAAREAIHCIPEDFSMRLKEVLIQPVIYDSSAELEHYRNRFEEGLKRISEGLRLNTIEERLGALRAIGEHQIAYRGYDGRNDRTLSVLCAELAQRIISANYPQWIHSPLMPPLSANGKIRVGYVSPRFRKHILTDFFRGWLLEHDPEQLEVYAYDLEGRTDSVTDEIRRAVKEYRTFPNDLEGACSAIRSDNLHIVVFIDIGSYPIMTQMAAQRLAPVQCAAWGRPVTTGLSTVDYFLSSALMDPEEAQQNYSETLVPLPGIGVCYPKPIIPRLLLTRTREDFGLQQDATIYLSSQRTVKYLPDDDEVFAGIAKRVPASQFVFMPSNSVVGAAFRRRLKRSFSQVGLEVDDHCVLLKRQNRLNYWNLNLLADVFLDAFEWSGAGTTMDAVACGLPVVTLPGRFMRGRQSYAILTQLGVHDTIARDRTEYVDIAARLGLDGQWRQSVAQRMAHGYPCLFDDTRPVRALEEFFQQVVKERLRM